MILPTTTSLPPRLNLPVETKGSGVFITPSPYPSPSAPEEDTLDSSITSLPTTTGPVSTGDSASAILNFAPPPSTSRPSITASSTNSQETTKTIAIAASIRGAVAIALVLVTVWYFTKRQYKRRQWEADVGSKIYLTPDLGKGSDKASSMGVMENNRGAVAELGVVGSELTELRPYERARMETFVELEGRVENEVWGRGDNATPSNYHDRHKY
ncbi:hypothetical protein EX30DRAFT_364233 [Ascodesmis nigricans]|uniref:Uncharacterized protein n=1 Tax=Ascodesmis nigricans TaxID=341454 RepID=A0A4S2MWD6_9PEZI|nr:hypothetical protein EX30DRAFT_364233 [Ascodesmis nigricans]